MQFMTSEFAAIPNTEALRQAELMRREQRRLARERGEIPGLQARRRLRPEPDSNDQRAPKANAPLGDVAAAPRLPARLTAVLDRIAAEIDDADLVPWMIMHSADVAALLPAAEEYLGELAPRVPPLTMLGYIVELTASGLPLMEDQDRVRAEALLSGRLPAPAVNPSEVDAWQFHLEVVEASTHAVLSRVAWRRLVEDLPLPVLDDLIESGHIGQKLRLGEWPRQTERVLYVLARVAPSELTDDEIVTLGWRDEQRRRALAAGETVQPMLGQHDQWSIRSALLEGDLSVLDSAEVRTGSELPAPMARLVTSLQAMRQGGSMPTELGHDPALFGLLEDCLRPEQLIAGNSAFHHWAGARRLYRLLDELHWAMAAEPDAVDRALQEALRQASALRNDRQGRYAGKADREARAVLAYLYFLTARPGEGDRLTRGIGLLEELLRSTWARGKGAEAKDRRRLAELSGLLQRLRQVSRPGEVLNPYLALCTGHSSGEWRQGWRDLRRQVPPERLEYINGAKDRIQRIETARRLGSGYEQLYQLPVDDSWQRVPEGRAPELCPPIARMPRGSAASSPDDLAWSAGEAARQIINSIGKARKQN
jgi:hypothetical protein